jgi:HEAT repeat protein
MPSVNPEGGERVETDRESQRWTEEVRWTDPAAATCATVSVFQRAVEVAAALPAIADALRHTAGPTRASIAAGLGRLGGQFLAIIPRLRAALRNIVLTDGDAEVRAVALDALARLGPMATSHVPGLVEGLSDPAPAARAAAAQDLAQLGGKARDGVAALTSACVNDPDLSVRVHAGVALWRVCRRLYPALPALVEGLHNGDEMLTWTAADCLGDIGPEAKEAIPALHAAFVRASQRLIRTSIALALERIDPAAETVAFT